MEKGHSGVSTGVLVSLLRYLTFLNGMLSAGSSLSAWLQENKRHSPVSTDHEDRHDEINPRVNLPYRSIPKSQSLTNLSTKCPYQNVQLACPLSFENDAITQQPLCVHYLSHGMIEIMPVQRRRRIPSSESARRALSSESFRRVSSDAAQKATTPEAAHKASESEAAKKASTSEALSQRYRYFSADSIVENGMSLSTIFSSRTVLSEEPAESIEDGLVMIDGHIVVKDSNVDPILCRLRRQQVVASMRKKESSIDTDILEAEKVRFNRKIVVKEIESDGECGEVSHVLAVYTPYTYEYVYAITAHGGLGL